MARFPLLKPSVYAQRGLPSMAAEGPVWLIESGQTTDGKDIRTFFTKMLQENECAASPCDSSVKLRGQSMAVKSESRCHLADSLGEATAGRSKGESRDEGTTDGGREFDVPFHRFSVVAYWDENEKCWHATDMGHAEATLLGEFGNWVLPPRMSMDDVLGACRVQLDCEREFRTGCGSSTAEESASRVTAVICYLAEVRRWQMQETTARRHNSGDIANGR
jgi:hypothetical protein